MKNVAAIAAGVNKLGGHPAQITSIPVLNFDFPIIVIEGLKIFVAVSRSPCQSHVQSTQCTDIPAKKNGKST